MINISSIDLLTLYLSKILYYGVKNNYSYEYIEERLSNSMMFAELENSRDDFLYRHSLISLVKEIYREDDPVSDNLVKANSLFLWLGEAYIRLFLKTHKTLYYLFLYIPLEKMIVLYDLYHEMDWSQLYAYYLTITSETTLLKTLLDKKHLSISRLATLTGISENTIKYYCLSDEHLYEAKYNYLNMIAFALKIKDSVLLKEIHNYTNSRSFDFDKNNYLYRSYLGLYIISFFSLEIGKKKYRYDEEEGLFKSGDYKLKVITDNNDDIRLKVENIIQSMSGDNQKTTLVIFSNSNSDNRHKEYAYLNEYGFDRVYIIGHDYVTQIGRTCWSSYLSLSVYELLIERAKKIVGGDFAI